MSCDDNWHEFKETSAWMKIDFHKRENVFDCGNVPNNRNHTSIVGIIISILIFYINKYVLTHLCCSKSPNFDFTICIIVKL